jgi:hypothetical protein
VRLREPPSMVLLKAVNFRDNGQTQTRWVRLTGNATRGYLFHQRGNALTHRVLFYPAVTKTSAPISANSLHLEPRPIGPSKFISQYRRMSLQGRSYDSLSSVIIFSGV